MAVGVPSESVRALSNALGLQWCREATIRLAVGEVVTVNTQCYATDDQLDALTGEIVSRRMVLIDADEYARLKEYDRPEIRRLLIGVAQGTISVDEVRETLGLPPLLREAPT